MGRPRNIVHITPAEIARGEKYHVTLDEKSKIQASDNSVTELSAKHLSLYSTVSSNSGVWNLSGTGNITGYYDSDIDYLSGEIDNVTSTIASNSSTWNLSGTGNITGYYDSDIDYISGEISGNTSDISNLSGEWNYGDNISIQLQPSGYNAMNTTLSGHLSGISDTLLFISSEPTGNVYPGIIGQNYYNQSSNLLYKCIDTDKWVRYTVTGSW